MTITLDLKPNVRAQAAAQAAARGLSLEAYLTRLLEQCVAPVSATTISGEKFAAGLDALAEGGEDLPVLTETATSRAEIYRDHDIDALSHPEP